jgi:uncharacterized FlaG/YvyC family protein
MNIKGLISNIIPNTDPRVDRTERMIKSDSSHDRDANGQQAFEDQRDKKHDPMTEDQLEKAMDHLRNLPATKEHKWTVSLDDSSGGRFVLVTDNLGTLIRRIPEADLWTLPSDNSPRGQLLKKSA